MKKRISHSLTEHPSLVPASRRESDGQKLANVELEMRRLSVASEQHSREARPRTSTRIAYSGVPNVFTTQSSENHPFHTHVPPTGVTPMVPTIQTTHSHGSAQLKAEHPSEVRTLFASGFPQDVCERDLHLLFYGFPGYLSSTLKHVGLTTSRPIAFVIFETRRDAMYALSRTNQMIFDPRIPSLLITVELAKSNTKYLPQLFKTYPPPEVTITNDVTPFHAHFFYEPMPFPTNPADNSLYYCCNCGAPAQVYIDTMSLQCPTYTWNGEYYNAYVANSTYVPEYEQIIEDDTRSSFEAEQEELNSTPSL